MPSPAAKKSPAHRPQRHGLLPVPGPLRYPFVHLGGGRQARVKGIADIFQGNGGKRLQTLLKLNCCVYLATVSLNNFSTMHGGATSPARNSP